MARSHLTLAALATSAVAGINITGARIFSNRRQGDFDSALLVEPDGRELIVRSPTSVTAEKEQDADLISLNAMSTGVRSRLPFDMSVAVGEVRTGSARAVVYEFLPGLNVAPDALSEALASSIGRAIAAIHALPASVVAEAGLPVLSAAECQSSTLALVHQAADTALVPSTLRQRWETAAQDSSLWQFAPTVIHGSMTADSFLAVGEAVTAVLGWAALRVGDPARDLHWLSAARVEAQETVFDAYSRTRRSSTDRKTHQRATLYGELEVARWLLHGVEIRDSEIVDDAVQMLDRMVDNVRNDIMNPLSDDTGPILAVADVEAMLQATPGDQSRISYRGQEPVAEDQAAERSASE